VTRHLRNRGRVVLPAVLLLLAAAVRAPAQDDGEDEEKTLRDLQNRFRAARAKGDEKALEVLREIARYDDVRAVAFLVDVARDARNARLRDEVLLLIKTSYPVNGAAAAFFRTLLVPGHPQRVLARDYLLERAVLQRDEQALTGLFRGGTVEDKFLVLEALGEVASRRTLELASKLAADDSWEPQPGTAIRCGTLALAVRHHEGEEAARMLLLLRRDPRFTERDEEDVREATRLWRSADLRGYVDLSELAHAQPAVRAAAARFLGAAGFEGARTPLLRLAGRADQPVEVRAAAVAALGGLRVARAALVRRLAPFARSEDPTLRRAGVAALKQLAVRPAAAVLASLAGTPAGPEAERALQELSGLPAGTDWTAWLDRRDCPLPEGA